jgi:dienelactone hydrolase
VTAEFGTDAYDEQLVARLDREGDDVLAALDFVSGLLEIDRDHIGVMGSSFGGINTLLAAARSDRFRCAVEFAGAAMNWDRTPRLRAFLSDAARRVKRPIFFIQAANDYSVGPTQVLPGEAAAAGAIVESKIYPAFGITAMEGHLLFSNGSLIWGADVQRFLAQWL